MPTSIRRPLHDLYLRFHFAVRRSIGIPVVESLRFFLAHRRRPRQDGATFSDRIFARKMGNPDARYAICADKVAVREWVAARIGAQHLIPVTAVYDYEQLDSLVITPGEVIKCANRSGGVYFTSGAECMDRERLIQLLKDKLDFDFAAWTGEPWYSQIPKRVLVEKSLAGENGKAPADYKLWVFNGVVEAIQVHSDRFDAHRIANLDRDWQPIPVSIGLPTPEHLPARPESLPQMLAIAETLGKDFDFVRIDLYEVQGHVYFGELTFAPASGLDQFEPRSYDRYFGDLWHNTMDRRAPARLP